MKTFLNIIIGLLIIANTVFAVGFYNYFALGENQNWSKVKEYIDK